MGVKKTHIKPRKHILKPEFFNRSSIVVAQELLGTYLIREIDGKMQSFQIVETEAYEGTDDMASHAYRGQTVRNAPMFGPAGTIYVYFVYGVHWMLNVTCGPIGHPSAVLIRGVEGAVGPGRLTKKLSIDKSLNGQSLGKKSGLWIEDRGNIVRPRSIQKTARIGVAYAGPVWSQKLYRFVLSLKIDN